MPIPAAIEFAGLVPRVNEIPGDQLQEFAQALGKSARDALDLWISTAFVAPGIPTNAVPPALAGTTAAPGKLQCAPVPEILLQQAIEKNTRTLKLDPGQKKTLDSMLAKGLDRGLDALAGAMMMPGVAVAGGVTVAPGRLTAPLVGSLEAMLSAELMSMDPRSWIPPAPLPGQVPRPGMTLRTGCCLPKQPSKIIGAFVGKSMKLFVERVSVVPGIAVAGGVTASPGKLM